jgi:hypothetical protein
MNLELRTSVPAMTYDRYRILLLQLQQRASRRATVEEIEQYYGLCLELEAGYCAVKSEVCRIASRLIVSYRKHGVAYARQSPVRLDDNQVDDTAPAAPLAPPLELVFVKTGNPVQDYWNLAFAAQDLAAQSIGWPVAMFRATEF